MSDPVWNPRLPQMPVDKDGNWMNYPAYGNQQWETVHQPFWADFEIDGMQTGRSSKIVILKDIHTGKKYPMFVADLVKGIQQGDFTVQQATRTADGSRAGMISGYWTGSKRGANYGIKAVRI